MADRSLSTKAAVLARLSSSAELTALVPASMIFPMRVESTPDYPFIRYGTPTVRPYQDSCSSGTDESVSIHAFAEGEANCQRIAALIQRALQSMPELTASEWQRTQYILDDQKSDIWHAVVDFDFVNTATEGQT